MPLAVGLGLQSVLALIWGIFVAYLLLLSILALTARSRRSPTRQGDPSVRFAIIIPAHDEEGVIEEALASIRSLEYPCSLYEVVVVADNCTDRTAEIARRLGATVYERHNSTQMGKGWALAWIFDRLLRCRPQDFDAFVVVDADSAISPNFLHAMAAEIGEGRSVIQARNMVINGLEGWRPAIMSVSFSLLGYLRPLARSSLGLSVGLKGNGMCLVAETLRIVPWQASSLAEDVEYSLQLCLHGVRVAFAPQASVASRMPLSGKEARWQAIRWEFGRVAMIRRYLSPLLARAIRKGDLGCLETALELSIPPMSLLFGLPLLFLFANSLIWSGFGSLGSGLLGIYWTIIIAGESIYVGVGVRLAQTSAHLWKALTHVPNYLVWKIWVLGAGWVSKERAWIRTPRRRS